MSKSAKERGLLDPMLCQSSGPGLVASGWIYELKLDGVRIVADKRGRDALLWYRTGRNTTASYPEIARAVAGLPVEDAVLDGEVLAFDADGKPSFQRLEQRIGLQLPRDIEQAARVVPVVYVAFDLLALGERDLRDLPLLERRRVLEGIVPETGSVRCLEYFENDGTLLFDMCRRERLEGIIAKRAASTYKSGIRSDDWVKMKCEQDEDFVVVGFTRGTGSRGDLGALDLASYEGDELVVRGKVGSGLDDKTIRALVARFSAINVDRPAARGDFQSAPRGRTYVKPEIVASVRYSGWTDDGRIRFPVFRGVRHDVLPAECRAAPPVAPAHAELAEYYDAVWAAMLPYLMGRSKIGDADALRATSPPIRIKTNGWIAFDCDTAGALAVRALLEEVGLAAFVKTGDAADYQVIASVRGAPTAGARALAELVSRIAGAGVVKVASSPILAPFSPVAGPGSRVSAPLAWGEVTPSFDPRRVTTRSVAARLTQGGDPMAPLLAARVDFASAVARIEARLSRG